MRNELAELDATGQAELVRKGEVSPLELVEAAIARIEALNPKLNAVISTSFERARDRARSGALPNGLFRGVPFLLKDLGAHSADDPFHLGMAFLKRAGWKERQDTFLVRRFAAAGLVQLGKTNTPELGLLPTTEPLAYGPTRNPWNPAHSPGGSSGGAAAAVAAGLVPMAHASDGGGSIRIPAAHCGLVGLKPSRGRISFGPFVSEGWGGFSVQGVVTRSVRDSASMLDAMAGPMPGDPYSAPAPARAYAAEVDAVPRKLRIGMTMRSPTGIEVAEECATAVRRLAARLEDLGHEVEEAAPPAMYDPTLGRSIAVIIGSSAARALENWGEKVGQPIGEADVEPATWALTSLARQLTSTQYVAAVEYVQRKTRELSSWWADGFDLLLTPTSPAPPPLLGSFSATGDPFDTLARAATFSTFTSLFNATGQPAISLPVHWDAAGLPIGAQLVAAYGREDVLLGVAAQVEATGAWANRRPSLHA